MIINHQLLESNCSKIIITLHKRSKSCSPKIYSSLVTEHNLSFISIGPKIHSFLILNYNRLYQRVVKSCAFSNLRKYVVYNQESVGNNFFVITDRGKVVSIRPPNTPWWEPLTGIRVMECCCFRWF